MRYRKSCVTGAGLEALRVVGTGWAASWWPKSTDFVSIESSPISALAINDGPETAPGTEPSAVPGPADASGTAAESTGAPGVSALTAASDIASGTVAPGVFSPT